MKRKSLLITMCVSLFSVGLFGCGSSDASYSGNEAKYVEAAATAEYDGDYYSDDIYEMAEEAPAEEEAANGAETTDAQLENNAPNRKLIKNVNMNVQTKEFDKLIETISKRIEDLGGYAETMDVSGFAYSSDDYSTRSASITARIPAKNLDSFVSTIESNSNITSKHESTEDVTLQYSDIEAHRNSLRIEQERLNSLLEQAQDLETIVALESRLTEVRYELESYESRMRNIDNQVDYSTVYLNVSEVKEYQEIVTEEKSFGQKLAEGFSESCSDAFEGFKDFIIGFVSFLPRLIALLLIVGIIGSIVALVVIAIVKIVKKNNERKRNRAYELSKAASGNIVVGNNVKKPTENGNVNAQNTKAGAESVKDSTGEKEKK